MKINYLFSTVAIIGTSIMSSIAQERERIYLWPGEVPYETEAKQEPRVSDDDSNNVTRLDLVTNPAMTVYTPKAEDNNGAAVVIYPGGGYYILAIDLEGHEVGEWLASLGYTAFVLEYRIPHKREGALMDAQRAMRLIRSNAKKYKIDTDKIGVLGFSAGGSLAARISTRYHEELYPSIDEADEATARPNFTVMIYPAYLDDGENRSLTPELKLTEDTPPMYLFATADDPYANSLITMSQALRDSKIPVESHLLPEGGHGYGLRNGHKAAETWPRLLAIWLEEVLK